MVLFLADDLPSANLHPLSSLLPKLFQIMNLITNSGGRFKRKRLQIWLYLHEISIQGSRIWQKKVVLLLQFILWKIL